MAGFEEARILLKALNVKFQSEWERSVVDVDQNQELEEPDVDALAQRACARALNWIKSLQQVVGKSSEESVQTLCRRLRALSGFNRGPQVEPILASIVEELLLAAAHSLEARLPDEMLAAGEGEFQLRRTAEGWCGTWRSNDPPICLESVMRRCLASLELNDSLDVEVVVDTCVTSLLDGSVRLPGFAPSSQQGDVAVWKWSAPEISMLPESEPADSGSEAIDEVALYESRIRERDRELAASLESAFVTGVNLDQAFRREPTQSARPEQATRNSATGQVIAAAQEVASLVKEEDPELSNDVKGWSRAVQQTTIEGALTTAVQRFSGL